MLLFYATSKQVRSGPDCENEMHLAGFTLNLVKLPVSLKSEAQKVKVTCVRLHNKQGTALDFQPVFHFNPTPQNILLSD